MVTFQNKLGPIIFLNFYFHIVGRGLLETQLVECGRSASNFVGRSSTEQGSFFLVVMVLCLSVFCPCEHKNTLPKCGVEDLEGFWWDIKKARQLEALQVDPSPPKIDACRTFEILLKGHCWSVSMKQL